VPDQSVGFSGDSYIYANCIAADTIDDPTSGATATATWTFTVAPNAGGDYAIYVQFPSSGTHVAGKIKPNALTGIYKVTWTFGGVQQSAIYRSQNTAGGQLIRIGGSALFPVTSTTPVTLTLYNTVPLVADLFGNPFPEENPSTVIVVADLAILAPAPASSQSSPIVMRQNGIDTIFMTRNGSAIDPQDPTGSRSISQGEVIALHPPGFDGTGQPDGVTPPKPLWRWSPSQQANVNIVVDDTSSQFKKGSAWTVTPAPPTANPDWYGSRSFQSPVTNDPSTSQWESARWEPELSLSDSYDVYAWFPSANTNAVNATAATYIVHYYDISGAKTDTVTVDQTNGGQWVRIGARSYPNDPENGNYLWVEVVNYSANAADAGRVTQADAVMFTGNYQSGITVTPGHYTVNVKKRDGSVVPTDVIFAADQSGYLYMLDAHGNGGGHTWAYWSYPSIPNINKPNWKDPNATRDEGMPLIGGFLRTSVCVGKSGSKDVVYIGSTNGRVYGIECEGRGDYDDTTQVTGTTSRLWTYPDAVPDVAPDRQITYNAYVAGTPAFHNGVIYVPTLEGRVYALDAKGDGDGTTTEKWIYPGRGLDGLVEEEPIGAVQGTVTYVDKGGAGDLVVFGTSPYRFTSVTALSGRVLALKAQGTGNRRTSPQWVFPGIVEPDILGSISYGGALYVPQVPLDGTNPVDTVYIGSEDGRLYCFNVDTGKLQWKTKSLGGAIRSAPSWARVIPQGSTTLVAQDSVIVTTSAGEIFAIRARDYGTEKANEGIWGVQMTDNSEVFGSVAISRGFMYALTTNGQLLSFSNVGAGSNYDTGGYSPVQEIEPPGTNPNDDIDEFQLKRISKEDYDLLRQLQPDDTSPSKTPYTANSINNTVLEWGETLYMVAYNFTADSATVTFQLKGPSNTPRGAAQAKKFVATGTQKPNYSLYAYIVEGTRQAPFTPGEQYWIEATIRTTGGASVGPFIATPNPLTIANPIAISVIPPPAPADYNKDLAGTVGLLNLRNVFDNEITKNGTFDNAGLAKPLVSLEGSVGHGQVGRSQFYIYDRSLLVFSTGRPLRFIMAGRNDMAFTGGMAAVIKPLPWEVPPVGVPNPSPDYPDIDRRQTEIWGDQNGALKNLVVDNAFLPAPTVGSKPDYSDRIFNPMITKVTTQVPLYQPANLTNGYNSDYWIWVDTDNDRRPSGIIVGGSGPSLDTNVPIPGAEAYRTLSGNMTIPPDEKMLVVEPTLDLGDMASGVGMTPQWPRDNSSKFFPSTWKSGQPTTYDRFFKPFTVISYSNVNFLNLRVASQLFQVTSPASRNALQPVAFYGDGLSNLAWMGADLTLVSNLDPRWATAVTLHKPRPGDRSGTQLSIPDAPYGTLAPNAQKPQLSVAIPIGQPVGTYSQFIRVFEDLYGGRSNYALEYDPITFRAFETTTEPTPKVKFQIVENRLTNDIDPGGLPHVDVPPTTVNAFRTANAGPAAYRDARTGNLITVWGSQRSTANNTIGSGTGQANWSLYSGVLSGGGILPVSSYPPPLVDLFKWKANGQKWWSIGSGPYPTNGGSLFTSVPGTVIAGTQQFSQPSFPVNVNAMAKPYVFWQGSIEKQSQGERFTEYGTFYAEVNPQSGSLGTPVKLTAADPTVGVAADARMPRYRPVAVGEGTGAKLFWYGATTNRYGVFVNSTQNIAGGVWDVTDVVTTSGAISSARDPYPVPKLNGDIDLVYSGTSRDRNTNEIYLSTYGQGDFEHMRPQGRITAEVAQFDTKVGNLWRTKGLDWVVRPDPNNAAFDIKVNSRSVLVNPVFDRENVVLRYESTFGGHVVVDPVAGTIQFPNMGPGPQDVVTVTYTPRTFRLTSLSNVGGHTEPVAFIDRRPLYNNSSSFRGNGSAAATNDVVPTDRYWLTYKRGGTSPSQPTTLYMQTFRLGIQLPTPIQVGTAVRLTPAPTGFYTVDYTRGKVYLTQADARRNFRVTYTPAAGNGIPPQNTSYTPTWIQEMEETAVPIEKGLAESQVTAFADPGVDLIHGRPGFIWLFWNSARNGASDVYFQTISPRFDVAPPGP